MNWMRGISLTILFLGGVGTLASWDGLLAGEGTAKSDYRRPTEIPFPESNPYSKAKADLGRLLFNDPIMSGSGTTACSSCHVSRLGWGDGLPRAIGEGKTPLPLRSPTLLDVAWVSPLGWNGKFRTLESVAFTPITQAMNMNLSETELIERLKAVPDYVHRFSDAFDDGEITRHNIEKALATYERSIVSGEAPFDHWVNGDENAISPAAKRGFVLFTTKGHCSECHSGWTFTDNSFHDIGSSQGDDIGRGSIFKTSVKLRYAFKTPTLRDVALRAPYMHDGSVPTLEAVLELYNKGGIDRPSRSESIRPLGLSQDEKDDLIAFLKTLTGQSMDANQVAANPVLPK